MGYIGTQAPRYSTPVETSDINNQAVTAVKLSAAGGSEGQVLELDSNGNLIWAADAETIYPGAGIPLSTGSAWGTSFTAPSSALVGLTDTQTLTNKTLTAPIINSLSTLSVVNNVVVGGDLTVNGTTTTIDSQTLSVKDKNIEMGVVSSPSDATADGGGLTLKGATDKTFNWIDSTDAWTSSEHIKLASGKTFIGDGSTLTALNASNLGSGTIPDARFPATLPAASGANLTALNGSNISSGTIAAARVATLNQDTTGTAANATTLASSRNFSLTGEITASDTAFNGSADCDIATTVADNVIDEANLKVSNSPTNGYFLSAQSGNTGGLTWAAVDLTNLSASNLTSGTIPDARFPATLPAASGTNLTALNASNLSSGTVGTARLGSGTASSSTFLRGDGSWASAADATKLPLAGGTVTGDLTIETTAGGDFLFDNSDNALLVGDNTSIKFGAGTDFQLSSDGTNDGGVLLAAGEFRIASSGSSKAINIMKGTSAYLGRFLTDGAVELYYNGNKKAETVTGGFTVTGTCTATTFSGSGSSLTALNASNLSSGTVGTARLGSGTASSSTFLRGDGSWAAAGGPGTGEQYVHLETTNSPSNTGVNTFAGYNAGTSFTTADHTTLFGYQAGSSITGAGNNSFFGSNAGKDTTGTDNSGFGQAALEANTTGTNNVAMGRKALQSNTTGADNIAIGHEALKSGATNTQTIAIGTGVFSQGADSYNTAIGYYACRWQTGDSNVAIGHSALHYGTDCDDNVAIGYYAMNGNSSTPCSGDRNVAVGYEALKAYDNCGNSTAVGYRALTACTVGQHNTAIGYKAGDSLTSGTDCTFLGREAGAGVTTGLYNTAIGAESMMGAVTGNHNVAVGRDGLRAITSGAYNIALGNDTNRVNTTGSNNISIGHEALFNNTVSSNVGIGYQALKDCTTGPQNTSVGYLALKSVTTAKENTGHGYEAGSAVTTGDSNTILGFKAGDALTTGDNNIIIGANAAASAVGVDNEITLGDAGITKFRVPGLNFSIKDSTATDNYVLTVDANGDAGWEAASSGVASDAQFNTLGGTNAGDAIASGGTKSSLFGYEAGTDITTGDNYVGIGYRSLYNNVDGWNTIAIGSETVYTSTKYNNGVIIGHHAGRELDGSTGNAANAVAIGYLAMGRIEEGGYNSIAIGSEALYGASGSDGGSYSIAIGYDTQKNVTTGYSNECVGHSSLGNLTTGSNNTCMGRSSLGALTTGTANVAMGYLAGQYCSSGAENTLIGNYAARDITTGTYNTVIGSKAGQAHVVGDSDLTTGSNNTVIGYYAQVSASDVSNEVTIGNTSITKFRIPGINFELADNGGTPANGTVLTMASGGATWAAAGGGVTSDAQYNTVGGTNAGDSFTGTDAENNTFFGYNAGTALTTADSNTAFGSDALRSATTPTGNVAIGYNALEVNTTGAQNVLMGYNAGYGLTTGSNNTGVGGWVMHSNTTGNYNTCMGYAAGGNLSTGSDNTCIGYNSGKWLGSGSYNTGIGMYSLWNTTGNNNTSIGYQAGGAQTSGNANTLVGHKAGYSGTNDLTTGTNNLIIGYQAAASSATVSNEITLGDTAVTKLRVPGLNSFEINDSGQFSGVASTASGTAGVRKITASTSAPSGGSDGDLWVVYS